MKELINNCSHKGTVGYELRTIHNLIHRKIDEKHKETLNDYIAEIHMWIMGYLYNNYEKDIFQRDLESVFEVRRSTMTGILQTMEKNGLINRVSVDYDARLKKLVLTDKAIEYLEKSLFIKIKFEAAMIEGISDSDLKIFFKVIERIKQNLINLDNN